MGLIRKKLRRLKTLKIFPGRGSKQHKKQRRERKKKRKDIKERREKRKNIGQYVDQQFFLKPKDGKSSKRLQRGKNRIPIWIFLSSIL